MERLHEQMETLRQENDRLRDEATTEYRAAEASSMRAARAEQQLEVVERQKDEAQKDALYVKKQLEALQASVEIIQAERDEAVGKLRSLGLAVVDAMCDQSSTCRAIEHKPWCFGYQPAYGTGGNLPEAS